MNRAYSFITVKAVDDDARIIEGIASTPEPDRHGDVVNPLGAKFTLPPPFLWQHNHEEPIGHVIEAEATADGIAFKAQLAKTDEVGKLKDLLDFAWQSIKLKLVGAVSIGFKPIKFAFIDTGVDFEEWDWLELSAVTVPANAGATITAVKSIDAGLRKAAGVTDDEIPAPPSPAATVNMGRVVKLDAPAKNAEKPFVIREIKRSRATANS